MDNYFDILVYSSMMVLIISLILAFIRLIKGPSISDRVVSLDLIASIIMGMILVYTILIKDAIYVDIVIVISLISFIGTVAISTYLKQKMVEK
ncbi:MAG: hypothetical protein JXA77_12135 [Bacteroidales bacterium]|nr:hypothetical protein [Bacteroidales bacterium]MBN2821310.1 hypothetical protein [Bacteroidales bacterium]